MGRRPWGRVVPPGPQQGGAVWALPRLLQSTPHSSVLSLMEACRGAGGISTTPVSHSLGIHSGVQVPGTRQPVCFGHSRASLGMSHCATWAQTAEKELWDSHWDARKNKGTVKGRGLEMGVAQRFSRENGQVWAPEGGKQGGWSGWTAKAGVVGWVRSPARVAGVGRASGTQWLRDTPTSPLPSRCPWGQQGSTGAAEGSRPQPDSSLNPSCPSWLLAHK